MILIKRFRYFLPIQYTTINAFYLFSQSSLGVKNLWECNHKKIKSYYSIRNGTSLAEGSLTFQRHEHHKVSSSHTIQILITQWKLRALQLFILRTIPCTPLYKIQSTTVSLIDFHSTEYRILYPAWQSQYGALWVYWYQYFIFLLIWILKFYRMDWYSYNNT